MAGFSLGGGSGRGGQDEIPPESLFLYPGTGAVRGGNDEIPAYPRGFELWQHQVPHQHQQHLYSSSGLLRFSDEPVPCVVAPGSRGSGGGSGSGGGGLSCQDCGNQAKKDCSHLRCRTCCKSRGFQCVTHVKSTWVPASKRRERQQQLVAAAAYQQPPGRAGPSGEPSKRPREIITTTISGGGMEAVSLPSEVSSPAVFRCVRVSPMDDAEDEIAYQTAVSIGGHVFKGLLYDQGPAETQYHHGDSSSSAAAAITTTATISPALTSSAAATTTAATSAGMLDPSALYPAPLSAFMAGTQFFPHHSRP